MTPDAVLALARDAAQVLLVVGGPLLAAGLVSGVAVSLLQAATQLHEPSLTFLPKMLAVGGVLALGGHWMLSHLVLYTVRLLSGLDAWAR